MTTIIKLRNSGKKYTHSLVKLHVYTHIQPFKSAKDFYASVN